jgi:hypothetical protein
MSRAKPEKIAFSTFYTLAAAVSWEVPPRPRPDSWDFPPHAASAILQRSIDIRRTDANLVRGGA